MYYNILLDEEMDEAYLNIKTTQTLSMLKVNTNPK